MKLDLTDRQMEVIRQALRLQEESHKRNGFKILHLEVGILRNLIADAIIDNMKAIV